MSDRSHTIQLTHAGLRRGDRTLWDDLDLTVRPGEFVAVLGPNGAGKTTLFKVLLGLLPLTAGTVKVLGQPPKRGNTHIGYIPQQKSLDADIPLRGRDLVRLGITGFHYGIGRRSPAVERHVQEVIAAVGASAYADVPLGLLSGGEQQRLRVAQALAGQPEILLCDEPLLSLDIASQHMVTELIHTYRQQRNASVLFVTHEINPVLKYVDRVLYLANGQWVIDTPDKVLQSRTLSKLYGTEVEVVKVRDRVLVLDVDGGEMTTHDHHGGER